MIVLPSGLWYEKLVGPQLVLIFRNVSLQLPNNFFWAWVIEIFGWEFEIFGGMIM